MYLLYSIDESEKTLIDARTCRDLDKCVADAIELVRQQTDCHEPETLVNAFRNCGEVSESGLTFGVRLLPEAGPIPVNPMATAYTELDGIARSIANDVARNINRGVAATLSKMPYKAQYVLEKVIEMLQERV